MEGQWEETGLDVSFEKSCGDRTLVGESEQGGMELCIGESCRPSPLGKEPGED